jgi:ABC-2 type transport system ATP-binding protein
MEPILTVENLTKRFNGKEALKGIGFTLAAGEVLSLLGPNGAGKTTLLKLLCGLLKPTAGTIRILGRDVAGNPVETKRHLSFIPDHPDLYERLTGWEYLAFVASTHELARTSWHPEAERLLAYFSLDGEAAALIGTYSHGMRQRLCFTAALLTAPRLLLIDEPWVGLDPRHLRKAIAAIAEAARNGAAVLLSTHSLSLAEEIGGRITILDRGTIRWDGPKERLVGQKQRLEDVFLNLTEANGA